MSNQLRLSGLLFIETQSRFFSTKINRGCQGVSWEIADPVPAYSRGCFVIGLVQFMPSNLRVGVRFH